MSDRQPAQQDRSPWLIAVAGLALVLCCAGPALIAGGILATIGQTLSNGFVIAVGLAIVAGGVVFALSRRSRRCGPEEQCAPSTSRRIGSRRRR
jgi:mercuric ion transport protein